MCVIRKAWKDSIAALPPEERCVIYEAAIDYESGEACNVEGLDGFAKMAWTFIKDAIDQQKESEAREAKRTEMLRANGAKGGRPRSKKQESEEQFSETFGYENRKPLVLKLENQEKTKGYENSKPLVSEKITNGFEFEKPLVSEEKESEKEEISLPPAPLSLIEEKEKEKEIVVNVVNDARACVREKSFLEQCREELERGSEWVDSLGRTLMRYAGRDQPFPTNAIGIWLSTFDDEKVAGGRENWNLSDYKNNFLHWMRIQLEYKARQENSPDSLRRRLQTTQERSIASREQAEQYHEQGVRKTLEGGHEVELLDW